MEFFEVVNNRRSIRKFKEANISDDIIKALIETAQKAPSWKNSQVSKYYAVNTAEKINEFRDYLPWFNQSNTKNAGAYIVTTVVNGISGFNSDGTYSTNLKDGYQFFDNGLQVENLCLSAYNLELGTLIMGLFDEEKIRKMFAIPDNEIIVSVIAVGVPETNPNLPPRKNIDEILKILK